MFKKLNFKILICVFATLLAIVLVIKFVQHSKGDRNFKDRFFEADTAKITSIYIVSSALREPVKLVKNGYVWQLVKKNKTYVAEGNAVRSMLAEFQSMKPEFLAATEKSDWPQYQVTDTGSTRVKVEQNGKLVADFLVGKVSFKQYEQTTYVRMFGETNVYATNGLIGLTINRNADDFRNKLLVKVSNSNDIRRIEFNYPDSSFVLQKEKDGWRIAGNKVDSSKVANYLSSLSFLNGTDFVDDAVLPGNQVFSIKINGDNLKTIELKANIVNTPDSYIVTSNMNAEGRFSGAHGDLVKRIFVGATAFSKDSERANKK